MSNTNAITVQDIAKVERADFGTMTGGHVCCIKVTLVDGRSFTFMANRMTRREIAHNVNYQLSRA